MTTPATSQKPESTLQKEVRIFRKQLSRLGNCFLNKAFDLSVKGSRRRFLMLALLFPTIGFTLSLRYHPLAEWGEELRLLFQFLFNPIFAHANQDGFVRFISFSFGAVFEPETLRYLPVLLLSYIIALQTAATYLADIFEIRNIAIARAFIRQVALTGTRNKFRIGKGHVAEKNKKSPIYLIGGPGQVIVELDTVALFEKPNGQPHVIGPTAKGKVYLEGFERLRQAIDLRDQYTDALDVKSRSLDGVPVSTRDVRMVFSVWRGNQEPSTKSPYPFNEKAIESLVYKQAADSVPRLKIRCGWNSARF